ncbi:PhoPQ-activated pathogenicity-related family protein [Crateriforma conspicua]|uniref:PhoPQ-activated pathogenicity-related family protein n=1 Tax=Crateriforma conspicua TaxID=2527996 RepID=UPI001188968B|nr:PhoPQ-activated protein PqaA family protein [Crateriforma conspicua]QDV65614.1 PhoPQ-activated pathogenicity-related protein [Crateriforma conspicua]
MGLQNNLTRRDHRPSRTTCRTWTGAFALVAVQAIFCPWTAFGLDPDFAKPQAAFTGFIQTDEPDYQWQLEDKVDTAGYQKWSLKLTSQRWQNIVWKHDVRVYVPKPCPHPDAAILFINGGSNRRPPNAAIEPACVALAGMSGMPVVALFQVPNQPLLGGKYEDALIAATWLKYLDTGDGTWPLLFPMVKSAVKTMDCVGELSEQQLQRPIERFIVTGASKRGWTSWLSAAADDRVIGIAPMVIDTLNFRKQMEDQKQKWGFFSEQIADYTEAGLVNLENESDAERQLRLMMDPYEYRDRIRVPKLLINGANDRYWRCDALDNYWNDLSSPKNVLTIANAGHGLEGGHMRVTASIATFAAKCAEGRRLPSIQWSTQTDGRSIRFTAQSDRDVSDFRFWVAFSDTRDFRDRQFHRFDADAENRRKATVEFDVPKGQHAAVFADLTFGSMLSAFDLSTGIAQPEL